MKTKVFSLPYDWQNARIDDSELQVFQENRQIVSVADHFVMNHGEPMIFLVATYRDQDDAMPRPHYESRKPGSRDAVAEVDRPLFDSLRLWRNNKASASGVPNYVLFSNQQLAQIAQSRPASLTQLGAIHGIGEARLESHGREILDIVAAMAGVSEHE